jgi:hypothetical protein
LRCTLCDYKYDYGRLKHLSLREIELLITFRNLEESAGSLYPMRLPIALSSTAKVCAINPVHNTFVQTRMLNTQQPM